MTVETLDDLEPPGRPDFRRGPHGVPIVMDDALNRVRYRRSSSAGKILDDDAQLVDWAKRMIVFGASQRPEVLATVSTLDPDVDKRELRDAAEELLVAGRGRRASTTGTAVHRMVDRVDAGDDWTPSPTYVPAIDAYVTALNVYGLDPIDIEVQIVADRWRTAGTADRRFRLTRPLVVPTGEILPVGTVVIGDLKTGKVLEYAAGSYACQLASYASGVRYDVQHDTRDPFDPPSHPDWGIIVHLVVDDVRCEIHWVDLRAGRDGLDLAEQVRDWRKRTDLIVPAVPPRALVVVGSDPAVTVPIPPTGSDPESIVEGPQIVQDTPNVPGRPDMTQDVYNWLRDRVAVIADHDAAVSELAQVWPEGVPGLKTLRHTIPQLDAIADAVDRVESRYSISFATTDPRVVADRPAARTRSHAAEADPSSSGGPPQLPDNDDGSAPDLMDVETMRDWIAHHPRRLLIQSWARTASDAGAPLSLQGHPSNQRWSVVHALVEWLALDGTDEQVTELLDAACRAIGHDGIRDLGRMTVAESRLLMSVVFAITADTATLTHHVDGPPTLTFATT